MVSRAERQVMSKSVLILVGDFSEDYEVYGPYQALKMIGHDVDIVCPGKDAGETIKTSVHDDYGDQTYIEVRGHDVELTASLSDVDHADYDGLLIPGGRGPEYIRTEDEVIDLTQHFFEANKPVAAICHGQQVLTAADVVEGYELTSFPPLKSDVEAAGATWVDGVTRDRNLVTGRNWADTADVLTPFMELLGTEVRHGERVVPADD